MVIVLVNEMLREFVGRWMELFSGQWTRLSWPGHSMFGLYFRHREET
jgi:hypothetical protein